MSLPLVHATAAISAPSTVRAPPIGCVPHTASFFPASLPVFLARARIVI